MLLGSGEEEEDSQPPDNISLIYHFTTKPQPATMPPELKRLLLGGPLINQEPSVMFNPEHINNLPRNLTLLIQSANVSAEPAPILESRDTRHTLETLETLNNFRAAEVFGPLFGGVGAIILIFITCLLTVCFKREGSRQGCGPGILKMIRETFTPTNEPPTLVPMDSQNRQRA